MEQAELKQIQELIDTKAEQITRFSTRKLGDTPTDNQQLTPKGYVDTQISSTVAAFSNVISTISSAGIYGDGSDGAAIFNGSVVPGSSVLVLSSVYALTRNVYYTNMTVSLGLTVKPSNYLMFVMGTTTNNGTLDAKGTAGSNGLNGGDANNGSGGISGNGGGGGSVISAGYFPSTLGGANGGAGAAGRTPTVGALGGLAGTSGDIGSSITHSFFSNTTSASGNGGNSGGGTSGGSSGNTGGGTGSVATSTKYLQPPRIVGRFDEMLDLNADGSHSFYTESANSGGAGGGASGGADLDAAIHTNSGGGGGGAGSGSPGGIVALFSKVIINNGIITVVGGNGGTGGNGGNGNPQPPASPGNGAGGGGTGGGGAGGNGGVFFYVASSYTNNSSVLVTGGTRGVAGSAGGLAGQNGTPGSTGTNGIDGLPGSIFGVLV